jgi:hypothetical protein
MAEDFIQQKAQDVAVQMDLYLQLNSTETLAQLADDPQFRKIAIQPVGTGFTAIFNSATAVNFLHSSPQIQGMDIKTTATAFPDHWAIIAASMGGNPANGYYKWKDPQGVIRDKFMYIAPVGVVTADKVCFNVAATTYVDDFFQPLVAAQDR